MLSNIFYVFFPICIALSLYSAKNPAVVVKLDLLYFRYVLKCLGFEAEIKPSEPGKPEQIARRFSLVTALIFLIMLLLIKPLSMSPL